MGRFLGLDRVRTTTRKDLVPARTSAHRPAHSLPGLAATDVRGHLWTHRSGHSAGNSSRIIPHSAPRIRSRGSLAKGRQSARQLTPRVFCYQAGVRSACPCPFGVARTYRYVASEQSQFAIFAIAAIQFQMFWEV